MKIFNTIFNLNFFLQISFATCFLSARQAVLFWTNSRVRYPIWTEMRETGRAFDLLQDCFANCSTGLKAEHRVGKKVEGWTFLGLVRSAFGNLFLAGSPLPRLLTTGCLTRVERGASFPSVPTALAREATISESIKLSKRPSVQLNR